MSWLWLSDFYKDCHHNFVNFERKIDRNIHNWTELIEQHIVLLYSNFITTITDKFSDFQLRNRPEVLSEFEI